MYKFFAGIGSRQSPREILVLMTNITSFLYGRGYVLRSGAASGADTAFEDGVPEGSYKEIYLPWERFRSHSSKLYGISPEAFALAKKYHPAWERLSKHAQRLIARNGYQVLGEDLKTPVKFIICWTPGGKTTGGTAQALRIAKDLDIPVFNLGKPKDLDFIKTCLDTDQIFIKE